MKAIGEQRHVPFSVAHLSVPAGDVEVWPENWPTFKVFSRLETQWRIAPGGVIGLDYGALYPLIDREGLDTAGWDRMFDDIRAMEQAALEEIQRQQQQ
ncbi:DUF1799 domain-containing protein [Roseateles cavernae]|uniref:DUF1799 domain-containing protein n=1 Tax=Roseateles cavernae TaxID=3153578 RepID=UPI0032E4ED46